VSRWFRFYDDVINDPKVLSLSEPMRWSWVAVLCIASKHDGNLPSLDHVALHLRVPKQKAAAALAGLHNAGLLDKTETGFAPHNWNGRQYKSDVSTERVKRFRNGKRNVSSAVSETPPDTDTDTDDVAVDARAKPPSESFALAEKLLIIAGHDPKFWPPGWCGAPMRVETWLGQGWKPEIIVAAVTAAASRKRGPPANSVNFFENAIAEEIARQAAPLPNVEIRQAETRTVTHGKPKSAIIQAADDLVRKLAEFDGPARGGDDLRSIEGENSPRLLSHG
jgi:hypothetical protein